nr:MAG: replication associated protein [Cressdnaviricota sp.]
MPPGAPANARYWILTIREDDWAPQAPLPQHLAYIKGQLEVGAGGFRHWQVLAVFAGQTRLRKVKDTFAASAHAEPTRSEAAEAYVWKEDTRVPDTQFELGRKPFKRNDKTDWDTIWDAAKRGDLEAVPASIRVRNYGSLCRIRADFAEPRDVERRTVVYWGATGVGKSRRAWTEARTDGALAYSKDPMSKFWYGYRGEKNIIIDEFRGGIHISHLLRWLDRYGISVEIKNSSVPLEAECFWITSNIPPSRWYPDLDAETVAALERRLTIVHME